MKGKKLSEIIIIIIPLMLLAGFLCISLSFFTKNVIIDVLGMSNTPFSEVLLKNIDTEEPDKQESADDIVASGDKDTDNSNEKPDYAKLFPYPYSTSQYSAIPENKTMVSEYNDLVSKIEARIEPYTNRFLFFNELCVTVKNAIDNAIGWKLTTDTEGNVIFMNNGFLAGTSSLLTDEEINQLADNAADFNDYLKEKNIPFIYANIGSNVCPYDRQMYDTSHEHSNENSDNLVKALRKRGIDTIDFREEMIKDNMTGIQVNSTTVLIITGPPALLCGLLG